MKIGDACPIFELEDQHGTIFSISDYIGKDILVIFFYPKDDTPGCTKEVCSFRDSFQNFSELGCKVVGISSDSAKSHLQFANKHQLPYPLLSDSKKIVRKLFHVPSNLFGLIPGRVSYIVDKKGTIRGVFNALTDPYGHVLHALELAEILIQEK